MGCHAARWQQWLTNSVCAAPAAGLVLSQAHSQCHIYAAGSHQSAATDGRESDATTGVGNGSTTMHDPLLARLRTFGAYTMDDSGNLSDFQPNQLTTDAADRIERLTVAGNLLANAVQAMPHPTTNLAWLAWRGAIDAALAVWREAAD